MSGPASKHDTKQPPGILVVDDHPIVRRGIAQMLEENGEFRVCAETDSPDQALRTLGESRPDVAIVDLSLAGRSGLDLVKQMRAIAPELPILVLSMHDEALYAERVLRAGASGYIMKHEATEHVADAIRQVLAGRVYLSERMTEKLLHRFTERPEESSGSPVEALSNRELEVFQLVGQGLSTREVAERLFLSIKTVETHLEHIKDKLHLESGRDLVRHAVRWAVEHE
jgi:DNA-binding NarL/FixJ family response regulator